tara:strand:+ start:5212 stop:6405 length:1194 start_codon:yes stop_codon:yes gene_type:complete
LNKIIYISGTPISKISGKRHCPEWYCENGFDVEFWDLTELYYKPGTLEKYFTPHSNFKYEFPTPREFKSKREVKIALSKIGKGVIFANIDYNMQNDYWLRRLFKIYNILYFVGPIRTTDECDRPAFGTRISELTFSFSELKLLCLRIYRTIIYKVKIAIYKNTNFYKKPEFVVGSGKLGRAEWIKAMKPKDYLSVPSVDVAWSSSPNIIGQKYCVYVDETVIYNADGMIGVAGRFVNSTSSDFETYLSNICRMFDEVEKQEKCRVVIAASGKYRYKDDKIFGGRKIIYESTNQLIQNACLVLGHNSSGLFQAIIDKKRMLLFTESTFLELKNIRIKRTADFLKLKLLKAEDFKASMLELSQIDGDHFDKLTELYFLEEGVSGDTKSLIKEKILEVIN